MNKTIISGRLTADPVLTTISSGSALTKFSVAVQDGWGENEHTSFFNCNAWKKTAEMVHKYCKKGSKVLIDGSLRQNRWEKDGKKMSVVEIVANRVEFLDSAKTGDRSEDNPFY